MGHRTAGIKKSVDDLKKEAADIVKNTVPNYAFVGDVVELQDYYQLVIYVVPSEMIRTTTNIGGQAIKELKHS